MISIIPTLLDRLKKKPVSALVTQPTLVPSPGDVPMSTTEQEQIVKAALLPAPHNAIDATLGHLYPRVDEFGEGFTCIAYLDEIDEPLKAVVRKVLAAGAALELVRPDDEVDEAHQIHSDFYKLLARLRSNGLLQHATLPGLLTNGLKTVAAETLAPTESDVTNALADLKNGISEFVMLDRTNNCADFVQTAGGPPFRVECRIWLNDNFAQHFHITDPKGQNDFEDIRDVEMIMLHWHRTGRLPSDLAIKNITDEIS